MTKAELEELLDAYEQLLDKLRSARSIREVQALLDLFETEESGEGGAEARAPQGDGG